MHKPVKIGIDIRDLQKAFSGTQTYLQEIVAQCKQLPGGQFVFYYIDDTLPVYTGKNKLKKIAEHLLFFTWKQITLPLKAYRRGCDWLLCTDYFVPYVHLGFKTVVVFHDAFFWEYPQHYNPLWLGIFKTVALPAARRATYIITPSHYSAARVQHFTHFSPQKIKVIYEAPKTLTATPQETGNPVLAQLKGKKYLLHVGTMNKHKNLVQLITVFHSIISKDHHDLYLVLAGKPGNSAFSNDYPAIMQTIASLQLSDKVILTGYLSNTDMHQIYSNAAVYVFPSYNEGFGIPVLEAFQHRIPVVVAKNTCLTEIGGNAVESFNPFDATDMENTIVQVLNDTALQQTLVTAGEKRLAAFSWEKTTRQLLQALAGAD